MRVTKEYIDLIRDTEKRGYEAAVELRELVLAFSGQLFKVDGGKTKKFQEYIEPFFKKWTTPGFRLSVSANNYHDNDICRLRVSGSSSGNGRCYESYEKDFWVNDAKPVEIPEKVLTYDQYRKLHAEAKELEEKAKEKLGDYRVFSGQSARNFYF